MDPVNLLKDAAEAIKASPLAAVALFFLGALTATFLFTQKFSAMEQRLAGKDEELARQRERLDRVNNTIASISKMSNADLRLRATEVAKGIRDTLEEYKIRLRRVELPRDFRNAAQLQAYQEAVAVEVSGPVREYLKRYKADAIALRDEMLVRLPPDERVKSQPRLPDAYERHVNTFDLEDVETNLELLTRKLPVK